MYKYKLNAKRSVIDDRDYIYEDIHKISQSVECDYRKVLLSVRDQGDQGTCFAQSVACMKEWQELKDIDLRQYLSPQFFYNNRNYWNNDKKDGEDEDEDYGMTGRDVMKILQKVGICLEIEYPYGTIEKVKDIPREIFESASNHRIKNYARIKSVKGLKDSLIENGPCLITFPVYNYSEKIWIKQENDKYLGGHAMTVVGFNSNSFIIRNSWGTNWGDKGYCYFPFSEWDKHWECWTTIDINSEKKKINVLNDCTCIII